MFPLLRATYIERRLVIRDGRMGERYRGNAGCHREVSDATPVNWKPGEDVIIPTSVSDDAAKQKYPQGFKMHKPYLRTVSQVK
jgi:hypothetical protein